MIQIFFSLDCKTHLKSFYFWWEKRNMEIFFTVHSCPAHFLRNVRHTLYYCSLDRRLLLSNRLFIVQHILEHMDQIQLLQNISGSVRGQTGMNSWHQFQVKASLYPSICTQRDLLAHKPHNLAFVSMMT